MIVALFALAVAGQPLSARPKVYAVESAISNASTSCLPPGVARGADIVAIGTYEGGLPVSTLATHEGHRVKGVALSAGQRGRPLVLILTAYDPVVWDLRAVPRSRLRAVLVNSYHPQAIVGAERAHVAVNSFKRPNGACGNATYSYEGGPKLEALDATVRRVFGRGIDRFSGGYALRNVAIDRGGPTRMANVVPLTGAVGGDDYAIGAKVDGPFGMRRLLAQGAIRHATYADTQRLVRLLTRKSSTGRLAPVRPDIYLSETYVVLRPITVPTGMYGAHSATFLIPPGVPFPKDSGSHNSYWSLATGECRGVACRIGD